MVFRVFLLVNSVIWVFSLKLSMLISWVKVLIFFLLLVM